MTAVYKGIRPYTYSANGFTEFSDLTAPSFSHIKRALSIELFEHPRSFSSFIAIFTNLKLRGNVILPDHTLQS